MRECSNDGNTQFLSLVAKILKKNPVLGLKYLELTPFLIFGEEEVESTVRLRVVDRIFFFKMSKKNRNVLPEDE